MFDVEKFILEVESRPSIWDVTSDEYSDRIKKKECWRELVNEFGGAELDDEEKNELGK